MAEQCVLIVRHGQGRGRGRHFLEPFLAHVRTRGAEVVRHLRVHETGSGNAHLSGVCAVYFFLGDPLRELYPDCYAEATRIAEEALQRGAALVNPPDSLSNTVKSVQARLWAEAGIPTPPHVAFSDDEGLEHCLDAVEFPAFVRADLRHGQKGMALCQTADEVRRRAAQGRILYPGTLTPFVDTRAEYGITAPSTIWARFFHKKRMLVAGDAVQPHHLLFSRTSIVAGPSSLFRSQAEWQARRFTRRLRGSGQPFATVAPLVSGVANVARIANSRRASVRAALAEDVAYAATGEANEELIKKAVKVLGLGVAAVDYTTLAEGGVILWEANPYVDLLPAVPLDAERQTIARFSRDHRLLVDFLLSFLDRREAHSSMAGGGKR